MRDIDRIDRDRVFHLGLELFILEKALIGIGSDHIVEALRIDRDRAACNARNVDLHSRGQKLVIGFGHLRPEHAGRVAVSLARGIEHAMAGRNDQRPLTRQIYRFPFIVGM